MSSKDWSWYGDEERELTIIQPVQAVAVYTNPSGQIVIRQQDAMGDDDSVIVVPRDVIPALIKALGSEAAKPFVPEPAGI